MICVGDRVICIKDIGHMKTQWIQATVLEYNENLDWYLIELDKAVQVRRKNAWTSQVWTDANRIRKV